MFRKTYFVFAVCSGRGGYESNRMQPTTTRSDIKHRCTRRDECRRVFGKD